MNREWSNILSFDSDSLVMVNQKINAFEQKNIMNQEFILLRKAKPKDDENKKPSDTITGANGIGMNEYPGRRNALNIYKPAIHDSEFLNDNTPRSHHFRTTDNMYRN